MSAEDAHARWLGLRNRVTGEVGYLDAWYWEQCADCLFWRPLAGVMGEDWGVCANAASGSDGRVRFEHDGCGEFEAKVVRQPE
ncbi:DUF3027 domain-containing protein [Kribbella sp. NPDC051620]|uniref:DUF3027 domain-containing protein n=1 Tax=Kribbella sp. NPDC051620 TaxID=3364120 RepID=UPI0037B81BC2